MGAANNGKEGVELAEKLRPDVITMDYEMPVMNGISAVKEIMKRCPTPVLMFSSLTYEGARVTLDALEAGAVDFLPKNFEDIARDGSELQRILRERIVDVARSQPRAGHGGASAPVGERPPTPAAPERQPPSRNARTQPPESRPSRPQPETPARPSRRRTSARHYDVVGIGTSTGGPIALQKVLVDLPANFPAPLVLVQHMPGSFTPAFAERLNKLCRIEVRQAEDGDLLRPGVALLAPGGKQMMVENRGGQGRIRILPGDDRLNYRPSVDVTFGSLARSFPARPSVSF